LTVSFTISLYYIFYISYQLSVYSIDHLTHSCHWSTSLCPQSESFEQYAARDRSYLVVPVKYPSKSLTLQKHLIPLPNVLKRYMQRPVGPAQHTYAGQHSQTAPTHSAINPRTGRLPTCNKGPHTLLIAHQRPTLP